MNPALRHWGPWIVLAFVLATLAPSALAGAVYRCSGAQGEIAITNKPEGYAACTKLANSDYAEPAAKARKPVLKTEMAKPPAVAEAARPDKVAADSHGPDAAKPVASQPEPVAAKPATAGGPRSEYKSAPASPFADVVSETRLNGEAPARAAPNATERPDRHIEVRRGAVYKVARANGIVEYTNIKPGGGAYTMMFTYIATCYACDVKSAVNFATLALNLDAYKDEVATAASEFGVDQALLRAVIHAESAFNPNAISVKGAQGLMQLMPATANDMGVASPFDPAQNIRGGARYLSTLLKLFNGDERLAAAAYNSGPQNVQKYSGVPPFDETRVYVERVATLRKRYGEAR
ncbi:transglycosylase SLT domain-containing protein [Rudaea sp.]|uniref:lytic transglycosylase domain-containing protein n=1 Tax=Rudaea sp. TaxID=2136325 RepID=UPI0032204E88